MTRRFQFSLGRLLGSVSLLCLSLLLWRLAFRGDEENWFLFFAFIVALFAAGGILVGRPFSCILPAVIFPILLFSGFVARWVLLVVILAVACFFGGARFWGERQRRNALDLGAGGINEEE